MIGKNEQNALDILTILSKSDRHSLLIEGIAGAGKTFLAGQYAKMLGIDDFHVVEPKVQSLREASDICNSLKSPVVLCIENLDTGALAASYTLLKFLEEPSSSVYIVVTCRNIEYVPDTIISRSDVVTLAPPITSDLHEYSKLVNLDSYSRLNIQCPELLECATSYSDIDKILSLAPDKIQYFIDLPEILGSKDNIASKAWKFQKYKDGSDAPVELSLKYLMNVTNSQVVWYSGNSALQDLASSRISVNAVISKFLLMCKYAS